MAQERHFQLAAAGDGLAFLSFPAASHGSQESFMFLIDPKTATATATWKSATEVEPLPVGKPPRTPMP